MSLNLLQHLNHLGLSSKEIEVYEFLLAVEAAYPMEIAKETRMKRSTVYVILDLLKKKGLVREVQRGKRFVYISEEPERIRFLLEKLKLETEDQIKSLDQIIPQLKATVRKKGEAPIIKFFEGEKAVQNSMEELVANPKFRSELDYGVFSLELIYKLFKSRNLKKYIDFRLTTNKLFKVIYTAEEGEIAAGIDGQEAIKVDHGEYPFSCDISVFEDEVRFHMLGKTIYGILIKNPELAGTLTSLIKLAAGNAQIPQSK